MFCFGFNTTDREQGHAYITHLSEQSVQRSLIDHRAGEQCLAVVFQRDRQALKPICLRAAQMALDPDLIDHEFTFFGLFLFV